VPRPGVEAEISSLTRDAQRLRELKDFLLASNNRANLKRILEITEQLQRIQKRLAELEAGS
jgi:hypothetical protein